MNWEPMQRVFSEWVSPTLALGFAVAVPLVAFSVMATVGEAESMLVESVELVGASALSEAALLEAAGLTAPRPLLSCDAEEMRRGVELLPLVRSASVHVGWDGVVLIGIDERVPAAIVLSDIPMLIDTHGESIRAAEASEFDLFPLLVLPESYSFGWSANHAVAAISFATEWKNATGHAAVELHRDPALGWRVRRSDDIEFVIGMT
ncbi:MAG: cell division septal protein FtsQ, partial [Bradymonadia bacterium]